MSPDRRRPSPRRNDGDAGDDVNTSARRAFLRAGAAAAGGLLLGRTAATAAENSPPAETNWTRSIGPGVDDKPYGVPSKFERDVIRRDVPWLTATPQSSVSFTPLQNLQGIITPNGLFFERYHGGRADIDPHQHRLLIHGLVERPLVLTMDDIARFPSISRIYFIECPANGGMEWRGAQLNSLQFTHGMIGCAQWTGVKLSTLLDEVGLKKEAKWVLAEGADAADSPVRAATPRRSGRRPRDNRRDTCRAAGCGPCARRRRLRPGPNWLLS